MSATLLGTSGKFQLNSTGHNGVKKSHTAVILHQWRMQSGGNRQLSSLLARETKVAPALKVSAFFVASGLVLARVSSMTKARAGVRHSARALQQRACYFSCSVSPSDLLLTFCCCLWKGICPGGRGMSGSFCCCRDFPFISLRCAVVHREQKLRGTGQGICATQSLGAAS